MATSSIFAKVRIDDPEAGGSLYRCAGSFRE